MNLFKFLLDLFVSDSILYFRGFRFIF
jgi:hypothetical protein